MRGMKALQIQAGYKATGTDCNAARNGYTQGQRAAKEKEKGQIFMWTETCEA